ncbi:hypothetical protein [Haloechinothrix sp. LS1_15]|uniref:hypothetical protein n=1 Tax=Haloechinothrix sp. LS1_15 TaxID=2652248 RepID=UPI00294892DB|nr:hypothetical protein [Haloechinothrix sp. LS1_15]MDV6013971.1 hypothetical protein [Haloechinothrix sp. LS1_15]
MSDGGYRALSSNSTGGSDTASGMSHTGDGKTGMMSGDADRTGSLSRRRFLGTAGVVGPATALSATTGAAVAAGSELGDRVVQEITRLALLVATVPVPFPSFGQPGRAVDRVSTENVRRLLAHTADSRHHAVHAGLRRWHGAPPLAELDDEALLARIGDRLRGSPRHRIPDEQVSVVHCAIASFSAPMTGERGRTLATAWLDLVRRYRLLNERVANGERGGGR